MKKIFSLIFAGSLLFGSINGQILSEQNVTINMDLQPVLQLSLEGPEVIDFSFTTIDQYRNGITRYGANVLKVSSSVSFDLWANGFSQGMNTGAQTNRYFDILGDYGAAAGGGLNNIPCAALELHQFPANPVVVGTNCGGNATATDADMDYSAAFVDPSGAGTGNNAIYSATGTNPYFAPDDAAGGTHDKYIAGAKAVTAGCQVIGGTYLTQSLDPSNATEAGAINDDGYYFVMDYRIVPGLPARFPMSDPARMTNQLATSGAAYLAAGLTIHAAAAVPTAYINPGSYQMAIKYILVEDQ